LENIGLAKSGLESYGLVVVCIVRGQKEYTFVEEAGCENSWRSLRLRKESTALFH
jgi:hypothetical protein